MLKFKYAALSALFFISHLLSAQNSDNASRSRMLVNLMDYISKDYPMAVKDGVVLSRFEYEEQVEFANTSLQYATSISEGQNEKLVLAAKGLTELIQNKASFIEVSARANEVKQLTLNLGLIKQIPERWPNLHNGSSLFLTYCSPCHGINGKGDGPAGEKLEPRPTDFTNEIVMNSIAPFQAYNTIKLGIPGTAMVPFSQFSDQELWDLAFYITSIRHGDVVELSEKPLIPLEHLASKSDKELAEIYAKNQINTDRKIQFITAEPVSEIDIARTLLKASADYYRVGDYEASKTKALDAYLLGVEPIEARVHASDNKLFHELESVMMAVRTNVERRVSANNIDQSVKEAMEVLDRTEEVLRSEYHSLWATAFIAFTILIREGLEGFFIILAIISVLRTMEAIKAIRWIHGGWVLAILLGVVGWFYAGQLVKWSAESREFMEGAIAWLAVIFLLYIGFWLHGKSEATKWKAFVEERIKKLLNQNNMIGLALFSFIVVFRESIESVLFLSSLVAGDSQDNSMGIFIGFISSAALLIVIGWLILKLLKKVPVAKVFQWSSFIILVLAIVLTGQGAHALQEGGFLSVNSTPINIRLNVMGIYPTFESLSAQLVSLFIIVGLWGWNKKRCKPV